MALDFQQVRNQVKELGKNAPLREQELDKRRRLARGVFESYAGEIDKMREKVERVVGQFEPNLRCALPIQERLDFRGSLPAAQGQTTIIAADGSQIAPDRHAAIHYCLINVGAIRSCQGSPTPPAITVISRLLYGDQLYTPTGTITAEALGTMRDLGERRALVELVQAAAPPVITFTDGPLELWGGGENAESSDFRESLRQYLEALEELNRLGATTAGYVDKPAGNLVVRLLETLITPEDQLPNLRKLHPLRGVSEQDLYFGLLQPGERSAVFALQAYSARHYSGAQALHFFYINVGRAGHSWLARVEIPAWVAQSPSRLDGLHATIVEQCRIMGSRPYPYLLHRAHETARVSFQEKEQVTQMISRELRQQGVPVGEESYKQSAKNLPGRTTYSK